MGAEGLPAVEAEEGRLARVVDQVVLQPDRHLERGVAFGADPGGEDSNMVGRQVTIHQLCYLRSPQWPKYETSTFDLF